MNYNYTITINRFDENDELLEIVDQGITADEALEILFQLRQGSPAVRAEIVEIPDEDAELEPEPEPELPAPGKKLRSCGLCGEPGHNKKTCPANNVSNDQKPDPMVDSEWYKQDVLDMLRDGMSEQDIYNAMHDRITDAEFREAIEWANEQLDV